MAKAGSAAALAALGALGAMALRKRGREVGENFSEMENIPAERAPAALRPAAPATQAEPFQEDSEEVARARLAAAVPRARYDEGRLARNISGAKPRAKNFIDRLTGPSNFIDRLTAPALDSTGSYSAPGGTAKRKGGAIKGSKPAASSASKRADGIAQRGKTKGRYL